MRKRVHLSPLKSNNKNNKLSGLGHSNRVFLPPPTKFNKGPFIYYAIHIGGGGGHPFYHLATAGGRGGVFKIIMYRGP